jgi:putative heme transporter
MVNRLRADQEVVVESRGPVTVADESHTRPHHDSTAARFAKPSGGPTLPTWLTKLGICGYIPYIGAFLGGGLAVIVALGDGGPRQAAVMLVVVVVSNLALENFVEPKVMGRSLNVHPLVVLVVTAFGGLVGGLVGLILAVPFFVIARSAIARLQSGGFFDQVADRAEPTLQQLRD